MTDKDQDFEEDDEDLEEDSVELSKDLAAAQDDADDPDEDESDDDPDSGEADDGEADDGDRPAKKEKGSAQARIAELAKLRRAAEAAAFEVELRNIELEKRLAILEKESAVKEKEPSPDDFKYGEVDTDYIDALVNFRTSIKLREGQDAAKAASDSEKEVAATTRYKTRLDDVMRKGTKQFSDFAESINSVSFDADLARAVLDSDNAIDIAYHLSKNIPDLRTLTRATPAERARAIGRLEGRFSVASTAKKKTRAPEPLGSRTSKAETPGANKYGPDDQDSFDKAFFT